MMQTADPIGDFLDAKLGGGSAGNGSASVDPLGDFLDQKLGGGAAGAGLPGTVQSVNLDFTSPAGPKPMAQPTPKPADGTGPALVRRYATLGLKVSPDEAQAMWQARGKASAELSSAYFEPLNFGPDQQPPQALPPEALPPVFPHELRALRDVRAQKASAQRRQDDAMAEQAGMLGRIGAVGQAGIESGMHEGVDRIARLVDPTGEKGLYDPERSAEVARNMAGNISPEESEQNARIAERAGPVEQAVGGIAALPTMVFDPVQIAAAAVVHAPAGKVAAAIEPLIGKVEESAGPAVARTLSASLNGMQGYGLFTAVDTAARQDWSRPDEALRNVADAAAKAGATGAALGPALGAAGIVGGERGAAAERPALDLRTAPYQDIAAEAKRLGVYDGGPPGRAELSRRVEEARRAPARPEQPAPEPAPPAETSDAVQEQGPAKVPLRQEAQGGPGVRVEDAGFGVQQPPRPRPEELGGVQGQQPESAPEALPARRTEDDAVREGEAVGRGQGQQAQGEGGQAVPEGDAVGALPTRHADLVKLARQTLGPEKFRALPDRKAETLRAAIEEAKGSDKPQTSPTPDPNVPNRLLGTDAQGRQITASQLRLVNRESGGPDAIPTKPATGPRAETDRTPADTSGKPDLGALTDDDLMRQAAAAGGPHVQRFADELRRRGMLEEEPAPKSNGRTKGRGNTGSRGMAYNPLAGPLERVREAIVEKVGKDKEHLNEAGDQIRSLLAGNKALPMLRRSAGPDVTENAVRFGNARIHLPGLVRSDLAEVFGSRYKDEAFKERFIAMMVEGRLRAIEGQTGTATNSIVGQPGSPFQAEADYQAARQDPQMRTTLDRWKQTVQHPMEAVQTELNGKLAATDQDGGFINLLALKPGEQGYDQAAAQLARNRPSNARRRASKFTKPAGGQGVYSLDARDVLTNTYGNLERIHFNRMLDGLVEKQLAVYRGPADKGPAPQFGGRPGKEIPSADLQPFRKPAERSLWVDPRIYPDLKNLMNLSDRPGSALGRMFSGAVIRAAVAGPVELGYHVRNILSGIAASPGGKTLLSDFARSTKGLNLIDAAARTAYHMGRIIAERWVPNPKLLDELSGLGERGSINRADKPGLLGALIGSERGLLDLVSDAGALAMKRLGDSLAERGVMPDTAEARRNFETRIGQYNARLKPAWMRFLRESGISPFATAGTTFNRVAEGRALGAVGLSTGGVQPKTPIASFQLRLRQAASFWIGVVGIPMLANYALNGSPFGRPGTKIGEVDTGRDDKDGKHITIDPQTWDLTRRGMRNLGANAAVEGAREGRRSGQIAERAMTDAAGAKVHPFAGPVVNFVSTLGTGANVHDLIEGRRTAQPPLPGGNRHASNLAAAAKQLNPLVASATQAKAEGGSAAAGAVSTAEKLAGIRHADAPKPTKAIDAAQLSSYMDDLRRRAKQLPTPKRMAFVQAEIKGLDPADRARVLLDVQRHRLQWLAP